MTKEDAWTKTGTPPNQKPYNFVRNFPSKFGAPPPQPLTNRSSVPSIGNLRYASILGNGTGRGTGKCIDLGYKHRLNLYWRELEGGP